MTMKTPAKLSAGLVAVKGQAIPTTQQSPAPAAPPSPAKPRNDTPLNFKLPDDIVLSFKARAVQDRLKLNELFTECFAAYLERHKARDRP
jgi:hypothetical protein